eukprot:TRINITY_DN650_c0_g1_i2.p1 TRINITY_DN650_c0_g1~~TRINITY_DN650_c0_g1_i2.p1  ORF type:complete len:318 (-),score=118.84 TRINITY_DN650_c0_g1_i2:94-1047(-)
MPGYFDGPGNSFLNLSYPIQITGQEGTVVSCLNAKSDYGFQVQSLVNNVTFSGFTIEHCYIGIRYSMEQGTRTTLIDNMQFSKVQTGVFMSHAALTVTNSFFIYNQYALSDIGSSTLVVDNCTFLDTQGYALESGGCHAPYTVSNSVFTNGKSCAISSYACSMNVNNCTFTNNFSQYLGGAIRVNVTLNFNVDNSRFFGNVANTGGAISVGDSTGFTANNSYFANNVARYGGAVSDYSGANFFDSYFFNNTATYAGPAYYCYNGVSAMKNVTFDSNVPLASAPLFCSGCTIYTSEVNYINGGSGGCPTSPLFVKEDN